MFQDFEHTDAYAGASEGVDCVAVATRESLSMLGADILGDRDYPVIGLTLRVYEHEPVLRPQDVRGLVGEHAHIYLVGEDDLLLGLSEMVGSRLRLDRGSARVWWPGSGGRRCDPGDHPVVFALDGEDREDTLEDFGYQFDLTRPRVRGRINLIEDGRVFLEHELARAHEQSRKIHERLRDAQIEAHFQRTRAQALEAQLTALSGSADCD